MADPLLAGFMLLDLASFWVSAYTRLQAYALSYAVLVLGLIISSFYYVAASVVFPPDPNEDTDFDAHFMANRRLVMGVLVIAGLMAFELLPILTAEGRAARLAAWSDPAQAWGPLLFFAAAATVALARQRGVIFVGLAALVAPYLFNFFVSLPG